MGKRKEEQKAEFVTQVREIFNKLMGKLVKGTGISPGIQILFKVRRPARPSLELISLAGV